MADLDTAPFLARHRAATPGLWQARQDNGLVMVVAELSGYGHPVASTGDADVAQAWADARAIAAWYGQVPELVAELVRVRDQRDELLRELGRMTRR